MAQITLRNAQTKDPVPTRRLLQLARCTVKYLKIREQGIVTITFVSAPCMRVLNKRFLNHDWVTDVLSFRYEGNQHIKSPIIGEILIAPSEARNYARKHNIPYKEELARYVAHGLLHWIGYDDKTQREQKRMRSLENRLLNGCGDF